MKKVFYIAAGFALLLGSRDGFSTQDIRQVQGIKKSLIGQHRADTDKVFEPTLEQIQGIKKTFLSCPKEIKISDLQEIKDKGKVIIDKLTFVAEDKKKYDKSDLFDNKNIPLDIQKTENQYAQIKNDKRQTKINQATICDYGYTKKNSKNFLTGVTKKYSQKDFVVSIVNLGPNVGSIDLGR